jgi:ketosteroid isomerase-like protein
MNELTPLQRVKAYYRDLNTGDPGKVARHFHADANHYYTRMEPNRSGRAIGDVTEQGVKHLDGSWHLEHAIEQGDEVVIEWAMLWRDPRHGGVKRLNRGTEWFIVRDGLIEEVRAYHHSDAKNHEGDLVGFDHAGRGHTTLEAWDEARERDGAGAEATDRVRP